MDLGLLFFLHKKEEKRLYDITYNKKNKERFKQRKANYYQSIKERDKEKNKAYRDKRKPRHTEYCRERYRNDAVYRQKNRDFRWKRMYGEYWEAMKLARDITAEFQKQVPDKYDRQKLKGKYKRLDERRKLDKFLTK